MSSTLQDASHARRNGKAITSADADTPLLGVEVPLWLGRLFTPSAERPLKEPPVLSPLSGLPDCRLGRCRGRGGYCRARAGGGRQQGHCQPASCCTVCRLSAVKRHRHLHATEPCGCLIPYFGRGAVPVMLLLYVLPLVEACNVVTNGCTIKCRSMGTAAVQLLQNLCCALFKQIKPM